jgi:outer membrane protein assembly factor BamE
MYRILIFLTCSFACLLTGGCAAWLPNFYTIDIRQGNYLDTATVEQLRPGMNKRQVQFLLGTPLLTDAFHSNRWDYVYSLQKDGELVQERHLSLFFEGELLNRIEGSDELLN